MKVGDILSHNVSLKALNKKYGLDMCTHFKYNDGDAHRNNKGELYPDVFIHGKADE